MIIDSHSHLSIITKNGSFAGVKKELLKEMAKNKVSLAIVIPDNVFGSRCADLETVRKLIKNEPKLSMVATLKVEAVDKNNLRLIAGLFAERQALGFKIFPGHDPVYPTDERWRPIFELCQRFGRPLIVHTGINSHNRSAAKYNDPKYLVKIAKKYPRLKIVIAHYFWPRLDYCFKMTEGLKNIYFDTSALADAEVVKESGGQKKIREILAKTVRRRPDSVLFGTDWPITDIKKHIALVDSLPVSRKERAAVFSLNAKNIFNL